MKNISIFTFIFLWFTIGCSDYKDTSNHNFTILPIGKSLGSNKVSSLLVLNNYSITPLATTDSSLLYNFTICEDLENHFLLTDFNNLYYFKKDGMFEYKISQKGNGPGEYIFINDCTVDKKHNHIYIHDFQKRTILAYDLKGNHIESYKNDSIAALKWTPENYFIATYSPSEQWKHSIGIYDIKLNPQKTFLQKEKTPRNVNLFQINSIYNFNNYYYTYLSDTLYQISPDEIKPFLVIDKGHMKLPDKLLHQISTNKQREHYIWGEYGLLIGKYYFFYFNHKEKSYYDIWDIENNTLIIRNKAAYDNEKQGIPIIINNQLLYLWPKTAIGEHLYFIVSENDMSKIIPERESDENPIIIKANINDLSFQHN